MKLVFPVQSRHHGNTFVLPCGHLDFELAVTAQNDEFKGDSIAFLHGRQTSILSQETQYLASILTDKLVTMHLPQHRLCPEKTELALEIKFYLDVHSVCMAMADKL